MSSINTTITSSTISVDNITSETESIEVEKPLLCSAIKNSAITNSTITLTAPTVNIVGEINHNGSSYTDELVPSFYGNTLTLLEEDLSWTVDSTLPPSSTNFIMLSSAIKQAMKYYSDGRYTITIDVVDRGTYDPQIKLFNVDASHIKITGTITLSSTPPTYDGFCHPVFVFVNCKCPVIDMYIYSGAYSLWNFYIENSTLKIGITNGLDIISYSSNVEITSSISGLMARNSTIFAKDVTINHGIFSVYNSSLYLERCIFRRCKTHDITIIYSEANFVNCTVLADKFKIEWSTVRLNECDLECIHMAIDYSLVNMNLINLTTTAPTTSTIIYAYQTILNLSVSTLYTSNRRGFLWATGSNVKLSGLGYIYTDLFESITVKLGSIVSFHDTVPDTTNIPVNTLTSDGLIIG